MASFISFFIFLVLFVISIIHIYWAFGGVWPARSAAQLAKSVVGTTGVNEMPGFSITLAAACLIFIAGTFPYIYLFLYKTTSSVWIFNIILLTIGIVFIIRGILGYTDFFLSKFTENPFVIFNRWIYSPLCITVGFLYVALIWLKR